MSEPPVKTIPQPEVPDLDPEERARRLDRLAKRLFDPDGMDRETFARMEAAEEGLDVAEDR